MCRGPSPFYQRIPALINPVHIILFLGTLLGILMMDQERSEPGQVLLKFIIAKGRHQVGCYRNTKPAFISKSYLN